VHVEVVGDRAQACAIEIDHHEVVLLLQRLNDRRADLAGSDHDDLHARGG
jgi:hypothetical protein